MSREPTRYPGLELSAADADAILAESPDTTQVVDYLSGGLSADEEVAFRERLRLDANFRQHAEPLIHAWESVPVAEWPSPSPEELHESWGRFARSAGLANVAAPGEREAEEARRSRRQVRRVQLAAAAALMIGLPLAGWLGYVGPRAMRGPVAHVEVAASAVRRVSMSLTTSVVLEPGSRFVWHDKQDANGEQEMYLVQGKAMFVMERVPSGRYVVRTPSGEVTVTGTMFHLEVKDPALTWVRVDEGEVILRSEGSGTRFSPLRLSAGERGLMLWGQPPSRAQ
jgi:ferric-dicitrate binding protein FerR (iron transport regulator)